MYYHRERKMVFLAQPHTGSRSTAQALLGIGFVQKPFPGTHHATLYADGIVTPETRKEWFVFTTVRNHFDLILSRVWKQQRPGAEIDWTNAVSLFKHAMRPTYWITGKTLFGLHGDVDQRMRFETLAEDLAGIVGLVKLPHVGRNRWRRGRHYREFYTPQTRALVEERFGDEMKALGYAW